MKKKMETQDITEMKNAFSFGVRMFKGFKEGEDKIFEIERLHTLDSELRASVADSQERKDKAEKEAAAAEAETAGIKKDNADLKAKAEKEAEAIKAKANQDASEIVKEANQDKKALTAANANLKAENERLYKENQRLILANQKLEKAKGEALENIQEALAGQE